MFLVQNGMTLRKTKHKKIKDSFNDSKIKKSKIIMMPGGDD